MQCTAVKSTGVSSPPEFEIFAISKESLSTVSILCRVTVSVSYSTARNVSHSIVYVMPMSAHGVFVFISKIDNFHLPKNEC